MLVTNSPSLTRRGLLLGLSGAAMAATRETVVFQSGQEGYHSFPIPALLLTKRGTLLAFCEGRRGSRSDTGDIDTVVKRSRDGGKTWSQLQVVADHDGDTIGNPCPVQDRQTGVVWLPLTGNPGQNTQKEILKGVGLRTLWMRRSGTMGSPGISRWRLRQLSRIQAGRGVPQDPATPFNCAPAANLRHVTIPSVGLHGNTRGLSIVMITGEAGNEVELCWRGPEKRRQWKLPMVRF